MDKKAIIIIIVCLLLVSCRKTETTLASSIEKEDLEQSEVLEIRDGTSEILNSNFWGEDSDTMPEIKYKYPIEALTLADFCRFSFEPSRTSFNDMVNIVGEPTGKYNSNDPYFMLYDETKIAFKLDENGYIYEPYIIDTNDRVFYNTNLNITIPLLNEQDIIAIKDGEYRLNIYKDREYTTYFRSDNDLSFWNFRNITSETTIQDLRFIIGEPTAMFGSGEIREYYKLIDNSYVFIDIQEMSSLKLVDCVGRSFVYKEKDNI